MSRRNWEPRPHFAPAVLILIVMVIASVGAVALFIWSVFSLGWILVATLFLVLAIVGAAVTHAVHK